MARCLHRCKTARQRDKTEHTRFRIADGDKWDQDAGSRGSKKQKSAHRKSGRKPQQTGQHQGHCLRATQSESETTQRCQLQQATQTERRTTKASLLIAKRTSNVGDVQGESVDSARDEAAGEWPREEEVGRCVESGQRDWRQLQTGKRRKNAAAHNARKRQEQSDHKQRENALSSRGRQRYSVKHRAERPRLDLSPATRSLASRLRSTPARFNRGGQLSSRGERFRTGIVKLRAKLVPSKESPLSGAVIAGDGGARSWREPNKQS